MSSSGISQAERQGTFLSPLGPERLNLKRFIGTEHVNDMFDFRVEAADEDGNIDFDKLLGKTARVELSTLDNSTKTFHGIITECSYLGPDEVSHGYSLRLRPWLWLLSLGENNRIFHEKSVDQILDEVFADYALAKVKKKLTKSYPAIHYTVQFSETDLNFVFRMLERHGINYHFEYSNSDHTLVLSDEKTGFTSLGSRELNVASQGHSAQEEHLWAWNAERQMTTGSVKLADYNHATPNAKMTGVADGGITHATGKIEAYRYQGFHKNSGEATKNAKLRIEQIRSRDFRHRAQGDLLSLSAGQLVTVTGTYSDDVTDKEYICLRATHSFVNSDYGTGGRGGSGARYSGDYAFYESSKPLAPEQRAKARVIEGPQTAKVVGAIGSEIDCDKLGRILVRFHWDLDKRYSMRCRVAQMWAHNKWGSMFIPRIGMEVVVIFLEGDPERPLVVGCVYNGANEPPWKLPGEKNIAGIKSRSTMNGGADNYNELYFDDTKGKELFNQQAERDMHTLVKRMEKRDVWVDRTTTIGQDEKRLVNRHEEHEIKENQTYKVGKDSKWTIDMNETRLVKMDRKSEVKMNETLTVGMNRKADVKMNESIKVGLSRKADVKLNDEFKSGLMTKMKAGLLFEIKVGASKITLTPASIQIKSPMISINGSAMVKIKGGMVMIN